MFSAAVEADISATRLETQNTQTLNSPLHLPSFFDTVDYRYPFNKRPSVKTNCKLTGQLPSGMNSSVQAKVSKVYDKPGRGHIFRVKKSLQETMQASNVISGPTTKKAYRKDQRLGHE